MNMCVSHMTVNPILDDISFSVNKGETIVPLGHTGSGKNRLISMSSCAYEFQSGRVLLDDVDIRDFSVKKS